jgi:hypothetical protein
MPATAGAPRKLQTELATYCCPIWSPDGKYLLVTGSIAIRARRPSRRSSAVDLGCASSVIGVLRLLTRATRREDRRDTWATINTMPKGYILTRSTFAIFDGDVPSPQAARDVIEALADNRTQDFERACAASGLRYIGQELPPAVDWGQACGPYNIADIPPPIVQHIRTHRKCAVADCNNRAEAPDLAFCIDHLTS